MHAIHLKLQLVVVQLFKTTEIVLQLINPQEVNHTHMYLYIYIYIYTHINLFIYPPLCLSFWNQF